MKILEEPAKLDDFIVERLFDKDLLRKEISFRFLDDLIAWNWWNLIDSHHDIWINAVRAFYFFGDNKNYDSDGAEKRGQEFSDCFSTTVLGIEFPVNGDVINELIGVRALGGEKSIPNNFDYIEACKIVYGNNNIVDFVDDVSKLDTHPNSSFDGV